MARSGVSYEFVFALSLFTACATSEDPLVDFNSSEVTVGGTTSDAGAAGTGSTPISNAGTGSPPNVGGGGAGGSVSDRAGAAGEVSSGSHAGTSGSGVAGTSGGSHAGTSGSGVAGASEAGRPSAGSSFGGSPSVSGAAGAMPSGGEAQAGQGAGGRSGGGQGGSQATAGSGPGPSACNAQTPGRATATHSAVLSVGSDACVELVLNSGWSTVQPTIQVEPGTSGFPIPFSYQICDGKSGTGTLNANYQRYEFFRGTNPKCNVYVQFEGTGTPLKFVYYD